MTAAETLKALPGLRTDQARAAILFYDGQFDDSRLLIGLACTAASLGAVLLNYMPVTSFLSDASGCVAGVAVRDHETGQILECSARIVINATGAFSDTLRKLAGLSEPQVTTSRGSHVVLNRSFLPSENALLVPETKDGRVLFAIPWHGHTLLGTTDVAISDAPLEPRPSGEEIDFILDTAAGYLEKKPRRADILSAWAGIRPLVRSGGKGTAQISRDHSIQSEPNGLITIVGGKWTTYRRMAQDCVDLAMKQGGLPPRRSGTADIRILETSVPPGNRSELDPCARWTGNDVLPFVRDEMACTVEDVLARRTRLLFLNARAAGAAAPEVARLLATARGKDAAWADEQIETFQQTAEGYLVA
ncbi:MAG: FAD-dependent oxidoreductase [Bryobacteraceae bacterium]|nr:FAD-dependent oxidoreductase [Bryobacteraceae bacterium]